VLEACLAVLFVELLCQMCCKLRAQSIAMATCAWSVLSHCVMLNMY